MNPGELRKWIRSRNLEAVTLGQLLTLMDLVGAESVEKVGQEQAREKQHSAGGVNARQKLDRLNRALKPGPDLLRRHGKFSRPTEEGVRVAGEFHLFLQGIRAIYSPTEARHTWIIGAGETWIQSLLMPAVVEIAKAQPTWRWEIRNLRAVEIQSGLRDGLLHFGFMRKEEVGNALHALPGFRHESFMVVAGDAVCAPKTASGFVRWLISERRTFAQQGSTWLPIRQAIVKSKPAMKSLESVDINISCQSHTQAVEAARAHGTWCIVPAVIGRRYVDVCATAEIEVPLDQMMLVFNERSLSKSGDSDAAKKALHKAILRQSESLR